MFKTHREMVLKLLSEYQKTRSVEVRNEIVNAFTQFVSELAEYIHHKLPKCVDVEDLKSEGVYGLLKAIERYDSTRGSFHTYCSIRIRGSIFDYLRKNDWVPRTVRFVSQRVDSAVAYFSLQTGEKPSDDEMARHLNITLKELEKVMRVSVITQMLSFENSVAVSDDDNCFGEQFEDKKRPGPLDELVFRDLLDFLTQSLSRKERLIMTLYSVDGFNMKEIGGILSLSESRVSQIKSNVLERMRKRFPEESLLRNS